MKTIDLFPPISLTFLAFCILSIIVQFLSRHLLLSEEMFFDMMSERFSAERIEEMITNGRENQWIGYTIVPIVCFIKFSLVSMCLSLGYYLAYNQFIFRPFFSVSIKAELVFLLPMLISLIWFLSIQTDYNLNDLQRFAPLSILNFFNTDDINPYLLFPLQTLNLFEVAYWLLLAYGITQETDLKFGKALGLVASSYGVGLLLWVVLVMFLLVSYA